MKTKSFVAIGSALLLIAGMFTLGAGAANATESNQTGYWQTLPGEQCFKDDSPTTPYILPAPPADRTYSKVIIKAGSTGHSVDDENTVYTRGLVTGATFTHSSGKTISHVIVCTIPTPRAQDATAVISFTPPTCDTDQKLNLGSAVNATWGAVVYSGPGNRTFSVTATATDGHKFADGAITKTFTGVLLAATGGCTPPPCLPSSAVSYTYNAATNSGIITVVAMDGYSNELCKPFWVTAASWTFDTNVMWPQTLDQWNPVNDGNKIDKVGTYPYAALVTCGQGDIYATFTAPGVPTPTAGVLNGPSDPYQEHFLHQMGFTGPNPTYTVQDAATCHTIVVTSVPGVTFTDQCGTANDTVSVPTQTGVVYMTTDSRVKGVGNVTVTATPAEGYVFGADVKTTSWSHDFTDEPCLVAVDVVPEVTFSDVCSTTNDGFTVPEQTGVVYATNDSRVKGVGNVTVTATPAEGYTFSGDVTTTSWSHDFTNAPCSTVKPIAPSAFDPVCATDEGGQGLTASGSMGYIQLDLKDHLHYTIDGEPTTSAQNFLEPGTYTVAVTVDDGFTLEGPASWEMIVNPPFCPPTFALLSTTASMSNITCSAQGSYTLANTDGVAWFVNGSSTPTAAGTYKVTGASTVNVEAKLINDVVDGWEEGAQTAWTFKFTDPTDCLPTLAFTGSNGNTLGLLLAGGLLLFGGGAIAFERTFRFNAK